MPEMNLRQQHLHIVLVEHLHIMLVKHLQKIKQNTKNQRNRRFTIY